MCMTERESGAFVGESGAWLRKGAVCVFGSVAFVCVGGRCEVMWGVCWWYVCGEIRVSNPPFGRDGRDKFWASLAGCAAPTGWKSIIFRSN